MEIERKFLLKSDDYKLLASGVIYRQGYISSGNGRTVRIRTAGDQGYITIKGRVEGISRPEYEYAIPLQDAREMLDHMCMKPLIEKIRYIIHFDSKKWEVDEFLGDNAGLSIAEIELEHEGESYSMPEWIGEEVTGDERYYNSNLCQYPYKDWHKK